MVGDKITENSTDVPKNRVIRQEGPTPGETVDEGTEIDLVISAGEETAVVQDVRGMTLKQATTTLEDLGFEVNPIKDTKSPEPKNIVTQQDPAAGTTQPVGTIIDVYYSAGPIRCRASWASPRTRPRVELEALGFKVVASNVVSDADKDEVVGPGSRPQERAALRHHHRHRRLPRPDRDHARRRPTTDRPRPPTTDDRRRCISADEH